MSLASQKVAQAIQIANCGNLVEAASIFNEAWSCDRSNQEVFYNYLRCLYLINQDQQIIDAFAEIQSSLSTLIELPILQLVLNAALRSGQQQTQREILLELYQRFPSAPEICIQLSALMIREQRIEEAETILRNSISQHPADPGLITNLAILCSEKGDYLQAENYYRSVVLVAPWQFLSHYNLAMFLILMGNHSEARQSLQKCLQIVPSAPEAIAALRRIEEQEKPDPDLAQFYSFIEHQDWDHARNSLLAIKAQISPFQYLAAASELRPTDYETLGLTEVLDFSKVVHVASILRPEERLVSDLVRYLKAHPTLVLNRAGKPTVSGFQTHEVLAHSSDPPILELTKRILEHCDKYLETQKHNPWFQGIADNTARTLSGWGVVLCDSGHQKRHVHPEGVISGVVYLKIPIQTASSTSRSGNLVFSRLDNQDIIPEVGKIVVFPSYLPHETVPITGAEERICIAFNIG